MENLTFPINFLSGSGSSGGGGGDDVTAWGTFTGGTNGNLPTTVTVNGLEWTIGYTGNNITSYTVALTGADDLVVNVSYDNGYAEYSGNINVGGAIQMTSAQARYLAEEKLSALGMAAQGLRVRPTDLFYSTSTGSATPVYTGPALMWSGTKYKPAEKCEFAIWHNATHTNSVAESASLATAVLPRWLNKAGTVWRVKSVITAAGGASGTLNQKIKVNTSTVPADSAGGSGSSPSCAQQIDLYCVGNASQLYLPTISAYQGGTMVTSAALFSTSIDSATTDLTVTVTGTMSNADPARSITHRLTLVEMLA